MVFHSPSGSLFSESGALGLGPANGDGELGGVARGRRLHFIPPSAVWSGAFGAGGCWEGPSVPARLSVGAAWRWAAAVLGFVLTSS